MAEPAGSIVNSEAKQFRLLLWLKFRLMWGASRRNKSTIVGYILMAVILGPLSIGFGFGAYHLAESRPDLAPYILRDILAAAYLFWVITPLLGFSVNESYDPTRLFSFPVRYQTMLAANMVGSLFEFTSILVLPILIALIAVVANSIPVAIVCVLLLIAFMMHTIALGQAVSMTLIGFLRSRRFRDIMIVVFPLIALSRFFFQYSAENSSSIGLSGILNAPAWKIANFLPPGWAATAMGDAHEGLWAPACGLFAMLLIGVAVTVSLSSIVLKQLFTGERGTSLSDSKKKIAQERPEPIANALSAETKGSWGPIYAVSQKEWKYFLRDPRYKALAMNSVYVLAVWCFSLMRGQRHEQFTTLMSQQDPFATILRAVAPMGICLFILLFSMQITFNIFGGEGPSVTMLFSFPVPRRQIVISKNIAYGSAVVVMQVIGATLVSALISDFSALPVALIWIVMSTLVMLAAGNLVSVKFPTKLVTRAGRIARGGQIGGSQSNFGAGCAYGLLYLLFAAAAFVAEIPAAASMLFPAIGWISPMWYVLLIPLGIAYSFGLYYVSLKIIDTWMITQETFIIEKLATTE